MTLGDPMKEKGREVKAAELKPRTIYVLEKPGRPMVTMWFTRICTTRFKARVAEFYAGEILMTLFLTVLADDTLQDDSGAQISVFEFLGDM